MSVQTPELKIAYNNKDITKDISAYVISFSYKDRVEGDADEIELVFDDSQRIWCNDWYPEKGAIITAEIGYPGNMMKCGEFEIDEIGLSGSSSGDTVSLKALSAAFTKKLRTKKSKRHEKKTLREIANTVAATHGLTVQGITKDVVLQNVTQSRKTDVGFLAGIASQYGYFFTIKGKIMVFTRIYDLEKVSVITSIDRADLQSYDFKDKSYQTYKAARVKYNDPHSGDTVSAEVKSEQEVNSEDTIEIRDKVENKQQAEEVAKAALHNANTRQREGSVSFVGDPKCVAGVNIGLTGLGVMCGKFFVLSSTHTLDRSSGYNTSCEVKGIEVAKPSERTVSKARSATAVNEPPGKSTWVNLGIPLDKVFSKDPAKQKPVPFL